MSKSRAWLAIEKVAELNELVYALNRFGEKAGLNRGDYRSAAIGSGDEVKEGRVGHAAKPDTSPEAISARLKRASELRRVCLALGRAKPATAVSTRRAGSVRDGARPYRPQKASLHNREFHSPRGGTV